MANSFLQRVFFRLRLFARPSILRKIWWSVQGAKFGSRTNVPRMTITWPHQVMVGEDCVLEEDLYFKFDGIWEPGPSILIGDRAFVGRGCEFNVRTRVEIAPDCLIASGCKFIDHDHGIQAGQLIGPQIGPELPIVLEEGVWLGANVIVLKGVKVGKGAVVAAGAVLNKSVPANEIWAGVPARKIGIRQ